MKPAEFEEREYETPLYNQLAAGNRQVWSPGQVFEGHIGVDHGVLHLDEWLFLLHGHRNVPPGAALARYRWPEAWFRRRSTRRLPNFRLNLFIQAKRPQWSSRPTKVLKGYGFAGTYWRFHIDDQQQQALEVVSQTLQKRALVVYAAPAFHKHNALFAHTRKGTMIAHSTFPSIASLQGHSAWNYNGPGATGVANADPTPVTEPSLEDRIATLLRSQEPQESWLEELKSLAQLLRDALQEGPLDETSRRAAFFDLIREVEREALEWEDPGFLTAYRTVQAFCEAYALEWLVLG